MIGPELERRFATMAFGPKAAFAFTGALLLALGTPPDGLPVLIWLGFIPLVIVAWTTEPIRWRRAFVLGWIGGLCSGGVGFVWIGETLERFAGFPTWLAMLGLFVFSAWLAVPFGVWVLGVALGPRTGWRAYVWPPVLWAALTLVWPTLFPYTVTIGFGQTPAWMQAAELGGTSFVEAQVILVGLLVARALFEADRRRAVSMAAIAVAIPIVSYGLGSWRMAAIEREAESAPKVRFALVQPNVPLFAMRSSERMERLWSQSEQAEREGAHVVVWPEAGAYPFRAQRPYRRDSERVTRRVLGRHRLPTIFGLATIERGVRWDYNTVAAMDEHGRITGTFDKVFLVPFGEYIPVVDPEWAMDMVPAMSHNLAGAGPAALPIDPPATAYNRFDPPPFSAGPLICFEDIFAGFARDITRHEGGIEVFVNVTIDTWFGDTAEPWEHLALAQFRSVEHRIPMVRSVAAGTSSVVDSTGTVVGAVPVRAPTASDPVAPERLVMDVALPRNTVERPTIYAQVGWLVPWLSLAASLGWLFAMVAGPLRRKYSARDRVGSNQQ